MSLSNLLIRLSIKPDRCAIERNRQIVSRRLWDATLVEENDQLEIVHFVGGG